MLFEALFIAVCSVVLGFIIVLEHKFTAISRKQIRDKRMFKRAELTRRLSEVEEAALKRYAMIFGLDNTTDTDVQELLRLGKKIEDDLGSEVVEEIVTKITKHYETLHHKVIQHVSHMVSYVVRNTKLLIKVSNVVLKIDKAKEDNGDEII